VTYFSLRELEAQLNKVVTVTTIEVETDPSDPEVLGKYVHRDENGEKFFWSPTPERYQFHDVATLAEADGVDFLCPLCKNHHVMVTFRGRNVPDGAGSRGTDGKPTRWEASGSTIDDLVLTPSIALNQSAPPTSKVCRWHGFVGSSGIPPGHAG
jgi:hypothetical protein